MRDEEINKKIKDAADQYHPAYEENAWSKMEHLLDKHLPQEKKKGRIIYLLPLILLLTGVGLIIHYYQSTPYPGVKHPVSKNDHEKSQNKKSDMDIRGNEPGNSVSRPPAKDIVIDKKGSVFSKKISRTSSNTGIVKINSASVNGDLHLNSSISNSNSKKTSLKTNTNSNSTIGSSAIEVIDEPGDSSGNNTLASINNTDNDLQKANVDTIENKAEIIKPVVIAKNDHPDDEKKTSAQKKLKKNFTENFGIGLSAGPDVSGVTLNNTGKITLNYGAELSYSFADKFTVRAGFYSAKKIYTAGKNDYYFPPGLGNYYYLQSVDANCLVYEVPLVFVYKFEKSKNHAWFASAGLSSYFMKKESYEYFFKYPGGNPYSKTWTVENQNKHYFSILDISAGYEYFINKRFSFRTEPYIKLPLSGIGAGKIKLNSAGVLFTIAAKPFK